MSTALSEICQKIVSSETFKNYDSGKRLLTYLCEQTAQGEIPKETTIGINLFDTDRSQHMDTGKVRVYVHNLRKKLQQYYRLEGKDDPYELVIPVGTYKPEVHKRNDGKIGTANYTKRIRNIAFVVLMAMLVAWLISFLFSQTEENNSPKLSDEFFGDLIYSESPVLVVLGDIFVFLETNKLTGEVQTVRNYEINSKAEYENFLSMKNDSLYLYEEMTYGFLVGSSAEWIKVLTQLFQTYDKEFSIRVNSRVQAQDLHDYNIVFVGLQKTAGIFNNYFEISNFTFGDSSVYYYIKDMDTTYFASHGDPDALHTDYGFISRYQGPRDNMIYMFGGLWDTSVSQGLKILTDPNVASQTAKQMESKFGAIPKQFEILLEVEGVDRTDLNAEILIINQTAN